MLHLVEATQDDVAEAYDTIRNELKAYGADLESKHEIVALSKCDAVDEATRLERAAELGRAAGSKPIMLSSASSEGVREALFALARVINETNAEERKQGENGSERQPWRP